MERVEMAKLEMAELRFCCNPCMERSVTRVLFFVFFFFAVTCEK